MDIGLHGKVALVTAASRGIGRAVAQRLVAEKATVAISARPGENLDAAHQELSAAATQPVTSHGIDLTDPTATSGLVGQVLSQHGHLDAIVINTPGPPLLPFIETTVDHWSSAYELLLRPAVQLAGDAARHMVEQGSGSIVFLTSTWVKQPAPAGVLSSSFRSAISSMAKLMATELAPQGVRVNQVLPGATGTDRMANIVATKAAKNGTTKDEEVERIVQDIPLSRWAEPEEIADAVVFLTSPVSAFTTGAAWQIDGGAVRSTT